MNRTILFLTALTLGASAAPVPAPAPASEAPVGTFFQAPNIASLVFSPNGNYIACLVPYEHRMNLAVIDLEKGTKKLLTNFKDRQASQPSWANNDRLLFRVDDDGKESFALYAVNRDGQDPVVLASGYSKAASNDEINTRFRSVLGRIEDDPKNILVLANLTYADWSDVAKLNLKTGTMTTVVEAPGDVDYYLRDTAGQVRLAVIQKEQLRRVLSRDPATKTWTTLAEHHMDAEGWEPIAFDGDNRTLFIWSNLGRKTKAIYRYDVIERKQLDLVFADETYDAADANAAAAASFSGNTLFDPVKNKIVGLSYSADRTRFHWLDEDMRKIQQKVDASLPDTVHRPRQFAADGSKIIYLSSNDRDPGVYYMFDRKTNRLNEIAVIKPGIDPDKMATMRPISYAARDGLKLHGYLTLPPGLPAKNLPMILHPHGGPFGIRDEWGYNDEVQFYASRGFAVLQVNYRGSGGYGAAFEAAGFKKWGLEMQDDLSDGVKWAIAEGIADPARVVISGASYGGYATMAGLTFTPELYCAGINYVGVTDINLLIPRDAPPDRMYWRNTRLGKLSDASDRKRIHDTSPANFADKISVPLLMAYGKNDPRVNIDHGFDMERALKKAGKTNYELIIEADEGHGFRKEEKRIAYFTLVDAFLKKNLPRMGTGKIGPTQVIADPVKP